MVKFCSLICEILSAGFGEFGADGTIDLGGCALRNARRASPTSLFSKYWGSLAGTRLCIFLGDLLPGKLFKGTMERLLPFTFRE